jgi:hypothetical protein
MIDGTITLTIVVSTTISATPSAMAIRPSHRRVVVEILTYTSMRK